MLLPRPSFSRYAALLVLVTWLAILLPGFAQQPAPALSGTLPSVSVLAGTDAQEIDPSNFFKAQNVSGTVVQLTFLTSGSILSGTQTINIALTDTATPITVANFLGYVRTGAFANSFIHRAISDFVIQGGGFVVTDTNSLSSSNVAAIPAGATIPNETSDSRPNARGTIAMARIGSTDGSGNPIPGGGVDSASSQWFINVGDNTSNLGTGNDGGYTVFGRVLGNGMDVVDAIAALPTFDYSSINGALVQWPLGDDRDAEATLDTPITQSQLVLLQSAQVIPSLVFSASSTDESIVQASISGSGTLILTYVNPGAATVTVTATDLDGASTSNSFPVTIQPESATLVAFDSSSATVSGTATTADLHVIRTGTSTGAFTVDYSTSDGTAISGTYYTATSGTLNFGESENDKVIHVPILSNTTFSAVPASFTVQLSNPSNSVLLGTNVQTTVSITNENPNPNGSLQFSPTEYLTDGGADAVVVQVTRTGGSSGAVSVVVSTGGPGNNTAINGTDYTGFVKTVTFADGDFAPKSIVVPITSPDQARSPGIIALSLTNPTGGATLGTDSTSEVIIFHQQRENGVFSFLSPEFRVSGTSAVITVVRLSGTSGTASVGFTTATAGSTGVAGTDYATTAGTLTFAAGETSKTFTVPISTTGSVDRTVNLQLTNPQPAGTTSLGAAANATLVIARDPQTDVIQFEASSYTVPAGFNLPVRVIRTGTAQPATAFVELLDSATGVLGTDYEASNAIGHLLKVDFPAGSNSQILNVTVPSASTVKTFGVRLLNTTAGSAIGAPSEAAITVLPYGTLSFISETQHVSAANTTAAVITVVRLGGATGRVSVQYKTANASGKAGVNYVATHGTLTFDDGVTYKNISVPLIKTSGAGDKAFTVSLLVPTGGAILNTPTTTTVTVAKSAPSGIFSLSQANYTFAADNQYHSVTVLRSGTGASATAYVALIDGTGKFGIDYFSQNTTTRVVAVNFTATAVSQTFTIGCTGGLGNKNLRLQLAEGSSGSAIGQPSAANVSFLDYYNPNGLIEFASSGYSVQQSSGKAIVTVIRSGTTGTATVHYTTVNGSAVAGVAYSKIAGTLTFPAGIDSMDLTIPLLKPKRL